MKVSTSHSKVEGENLDTVYNNITTVHEKMFADTFATDCHLLIPLKIGVPGTEEVWP